MTIVYRMILLLAIALIVMELFRQKELKLQANAAWVLIPFVLRVLMLA